MSFICPQLKRPLCWRSPVDVYYWFWLTGDVGTISTMPLFAGTLNCSLYYHIFAFQYEFWQSVHFPSPHQEPWKRDITSETSSSYSANRECDVMWIDANISEHGKLGSTYQLNIVKTTNVLQRKSLIMILEVHDEMDQKAWDTIKIIHL